MEALDKAISIERNFEVKSEAIQQIGSIEDARTHNLRLAILLHQLKSDDARIRDAAREVRQVSILEKGPRRQIEEPRANHAAAPPQLGDVG